MSQNFDTHSLVIISLGARLEMLERFYNESKHIIDHNEEGIEKCFQAIEDLKRWINGDTLLPAIHSVIKRIEKLESDHLGEQLNPKVWKFLTEKVDGLETEINIVRALGSRAFHPKKPHKCPVCEGTGGVEHPLTGLIAPAKCHACEGKGIVWG